MELAEEMHKIRPDIRIVLSTGFNAEITDEGLKRAGIHSVIMKPMVMHELAEATYNALH